MMYLPYLAGTADERQYRVMSDREQWFRVVMGQDEVARLITPDSNTAIPLPTAISDGLGFDLGLVAPGAPVGSRHDPDVSGCSHPQDQTLAEPDTTGTPDQGPTISLSS